MSVALFPLTLTLSPEGRGNAPLAGLVAFTRGLPCLREGDARALPLPSGERAGVRGRSPLRQTGIQTLQARRLRREQTRAERALWQILRGRQLGGLKFRRQVPVGPYIADFYCAEARLVVEVDGGQHADNRRDARRDTWMAGQGLTVLRFWNPEILGNPDGVGQSILDASGREQ